jgi:general secretion pathway protein K
MKPLRSISNTPRGSSLLLVLWAIMLMSLSVIGLVQHLSRGLDESLDAEKEFRARLLLESARTIAQHPAILRGDPLLKQTVSSATSYEITLSTEGSRLAINQLAASPVQRRFAQRLFEQWGLDSRQARTLAESIADWTDADDRPLTHGAEKEIYRSLEHPDYPYNKPFETLDDVLLVRGAEEMEHLRGNWRDSFTLYGDGTIDVHTAPGELLEALFDVTSSEIGRLIRSRNGPDGMADTEDDETFKTLAEARACLDVPEANYKRVTALVTLAHPIRRIECLARAGSLERRLTLLTGPGISLIRED